MKFYPSRAHRWVGGGCTGSVRAEANAYRMPSGQWADEGTRLHALAARALMGHDDTCSLDDQKQIDAYVRDVNDTVAATKGELHVEQKVTHKDFPNATVIDARVVPIQGRQILWDYKSGFRTVEVFENWQLIFSALILGLDSAEFRIVQPNGWHPDGVVRSWVCEDVQRYGRQIRLAMEDARKYPTLVATPSNCTYCRAVTSCAAARGVTLGGMDMALKDTGKLPPEAMRSELVTLRTAEKMIAIRLLALEAEAEARLRSGERIPGCGMRSGSAGSLAWTADPRATMEVMGIVPIKETLLTPTQAIAAGVPVETVGKMAKRNSPKMAVSTDVRAELAKAFSK